MAAEGEEEEGEETGSPNLSMQRSCLKKIFFEKICAAT